MRTVILKNYVVRTITLCLIVATIACYRKIPDATISEYPSSPVLVVTAWIDTCRAGKWSESDRYIAWRQKYRMDSKSFFQHLNLCLDIDEEEKWLIGNVKSKYNKAYVSISVSRMIGSVELIKQGRIWKIYSYFYDIF